jgi:hypothetical protein
MARFPGTVVTVGRYGPSSSDGQADGAVPRHGGNDDGVGGSWGGDDVVLMVEEEQDDTVPECGSEVQVDDVIPRCGDSVEAVGVAAAWTQRR